MRINYALNERTVHRAFIYGARSITQAKSWRLLLRNGGIAGLRLGFCSGLCSVMAGRLGSSRTDLVHPVPR